MRDLGIFAGRLYFDFDEQYGATCATMGLSSLDKNAAAWTSEPFSMSPLLFMQEWLAIRRRGQDFSQTMMGQMCRGRKLEREDALVDSENVIYDSATSGEMVEDENVDDDDGDASEEEGGSDDDE